MKNTVHESVPAVKTRCSGVADRMNAESGLHLADDGSFQEDNQLLAECKAGEDGDTGGQGTDEDALPQLLKMVPDGHREVVWQLRLVGVEKLLNR